MIGQGNVLEIGAHFGYFSGLTMLIPLLSQAWHENIKPWVLSPGGFFTALALLLISIVLLGWLVGSVSHLLRSLGWMMVIPGLLALVFAASSEQAVYQTAGHYITGFSAFQPAVEWFVEHSVPKAAYIGAIYLCLGFLCLLAGHMLGRVSYYL